MLKSMTAFGKAHLSGEEGLFAIEIQSKNRKFLDVQIFLPREFQSFDPFFRSLIRDRMFKGDITIRVERLEKPEKEIQLKVNEPLLKEFFAVWGKMQKIISIEATQRDFWSFLIRQKDVVWTSQEEKNEEELKPFFISLFEKGFSLWMKMKEEEGAHLEQDIRKRAERLKEKIKKIEEKSPDALSYYQKRLFDKIKEIHEIETDLEEVIRREVLLFADRIDIKEEIVRIHSHLHKFFSLLEGQENLVGDTLYFLVQEMGREFNTIGVKSQNKEISEIVIEAKTELKRLQEQLQNVE